MGLHNTSSSGNVGKHKPSLSEAPKKPRVYGTVVSCVSGLIVASIESFLLSLSSHSPSPGIELVISITAGTAFGTVLYLTAFQKSWPMWVIAGTIVLLAVLGGFGLSRDFLHKDAEIIVVFQLHPGSEHIHIQGDPSSTQVERMGQPWQGWLDQLAAKGVTGNLRIVGLVAGVTELQGSVALVAQRRPVSEVALEMPRGGSIIYLEQAEGWIPVPQDASRLKRKLYVNWSVNGASISIPLSNGMTNRAELATSWE